jgi:hypothetical protein
MIEKAGPPITMKSSPEASMSMTRFFLALLAALCATQPVLAIDKGSFSKLDPARAERVLMSFQAPLYYPIYRDGGNVIVSLKERERYTSGSYEFAAMLYTRPQDAVAFAQKLSQDGPRKAAVKMTSMNRIMLAQYRTRDSAASTDAGHPDFVIANAPRMPMGENPETIFDAQMHPFVYERGGRHFVPAFLSADDAIAFVDKMKASGVDHLNRVGLDFQSHLKLVESAIDSDAPIITFGVGNVEALMDAYVAASSLRP